MQRPCFAIAAFGGSLVLAESSALLTEFGCPRLVARLLGLAYLAGDGLDLGSHRFGVRQEGSVGHVGGDDLVNLRFGHAPTAQRCLDPIGVITQQANIDHACSK